MEKKKLLVVAASVGVFLAVVIGAAFLIFSPRNKLNQAAESRYVPVREPIYPGEAPEDSVPAAVEWEQTPAIDPVDLIKHSNGIQGFQPLSVSPEIRQENTIYINGNGGGNTQVVQSNQPEQRPAAAAPVTAAPSPAPKAETSAPAAAVQGTAVVTRTPAAASSPAAAKPAVPAASPPAARSSQPAASARTYDTFWIQTGSFAVKARAEAVQGDLAARGIAAIIENRDVNGKPFFRVRIGPYTSKNEADYWLALVKSIDGFEESLVWQNRSRL